METVCPGKLTTFALWPLRKMFVFTDTFKISLVTLLRQTGRCMVLGVCSPWLGRPSGGSFACLQAENTCCISHEVFLVSSLLSIPSPPYSRGCRGIPSPSPCNRRPHCATSWSLLCPMEGDTCLELVVVTGPRQDTSVGGSQGLVPNAYMGHKPPSSFLSLPTSTIPSPASPGITSLADVQCLFQKRPEPREE